MHKEMHERDERRMKMGCMCMECAFREIVQDNHDDLHGICVCRESEFFLKKVSAVFDSCDSGMVEDEEEVFQ